MSEAAAAAAVKSAQLAVDNAEDALEATALRAPGAATVAEVDRAGGRPGRRQRRLVVRLLVVAAAAAPAVTPAAAAWPSSTSTAGSSSSRSSAA